MLPVLAQCGLFWPHAVCRRPPQAFLTGPRARLVVIISCCCCSSRITAFPLAAATAWRRFAAVLWRFRMGAGRIRIA